MGKESSKSLLHGGNLGLPATCVQEEKKEIFPAFLSSQPGDSIKERQEMCISHMHGRNSGNDQLYRWHRALAYVASSTKVYKIVGKWQNEKKWS